MSLNRCLKTPTQPPTSRTWKEFAFRLVVLPIPFDDLCCKAATEYKCAEQYVAPDGKPEFEAQTWSLTGCTGVLEWRWRGSSMAPEIHRTYACGLCSYTVIPEASSECITPQKIQG